MSSEMFKWFNDNWDKIPERKRPLFAVVGRIGFDYDYIKLMKKEVRM